jgi:uncharacterized protein YjbI with pentapeptide repeats
VVLFVILLEEKMKSRVNQHGVQYTQNKTIENMIKKTMILKAILFTLCSNLQAQADLTRTDVIKLIAVATKPLDLTGVNLPSANLSKLNLKGANLSNADLMWTNLSNANLSGANLTGANLTGANLTGAILIYVDSTTGKEYPNSKTNFTGAILTGVIGYKKP